MCVGQVGPDVGRHGHSFEVVGAMVQLVASVVRGALNLQDLVQGYVGLVDFFRCKKRVSIVFFRLPILDLRVYQNLR